MPRYTATGTGPSIDAMTALELNNLVRALEEHYGVSVATAASEADAPSPRYLYRVKKLAAIGRLVRVLEAIGKQKVVRRRQVDTDEILAALHLGLPLESIRLNRYLPVRLYLSSDNKVTQEKLEAALRGFLEAFGLDISTEYDAEAGSWFKKLIARTQEPQTKEMLLENLEKARRALEVQTLQKAQSEIDKNQAEAASLLINALKDERSGVAQIGSLLVVKEHDAKGNSRTFVRSLTQREMIYLESHPEIVKDPQTILTRLTEALAVPGAGISERVLVPDLSLLAEDVASTLPAARNQQRS